MTGPCAVVHRSPGESQISGFAVGLVTIYGLGSIGKKWVIFRKPKIATEDKGTTWEWLGKGSITGCVLIVGRAAERSY